MNLVNKVLVSFFIFFLLPISPFTYAQKILPDVKTYSQLLGELVKIREETKAEIAQAVNQAKVNEAWKMGTVIEKHLMENHYDRYAGEKITTKLAKRLVISHSQLNRMRKFSQLYPAGPPVSSLSWHDYILLLGISDPKQRNALAAAAEKENWTHDHLMREIRQWRSAHSGAVDDSGKLPEIQMPKVGIYPWVMIGDKKYYNLGFNAFLEKARIPENEIPPGKGAGEENFHTYEAQVTRVVDGDTFRARIQVGFGIVVEQRVRLKRIDAPEIQTEEGRAAKALLEKILARDHGKIILQTFGMDQHGRSLANVFVCSARSDKASADGTRTTGDECQGKSVDQEILDADLALPME